MNRRSLIIILVVVLVVGALIALIITSFSKYNWAENYHYDSKQPYGCSVAANMLEGLNPGKNFSIMKEPLRTGFVPSKIKDNSLYVFIGSNLYYDSTGLQNLLSFVAKGNEAFIACPEIPYDLISELIPASTTRTETEENTDNNADTAASINDSNRGVLVDSIIDLNFFHPSLQTAKGTQFEYVYDYKHYNYYWNYFNYRNPADSSSAETEIGYMSRGSGNYPVIKKYANFIRFAYKKGHFYFHSTPLVFTNYHLIKQAGFDYADKVFGHFKPANIYWDEGSKIPNYTSRAQGPSVSQSPLSFILSQNSLRWAWYILLILLLFFILFRMKREQGIIPIPEPNVNTSSEFVETIGRLYFLQNDHIALAQQKMKLFLQFVRHKYNLSTRELDDAFISRLAEKARISLTDVRDIFVLYKMNDKNTHLTTEGLIEFHHAIDKFYKQCK